MYCFDFDVYGPGCCVFAFLICAAMVICGLFICFCGCYVAACDCFDIV